MITQVAAHLLGRTLGLDLGVLFRLGHFVAEAFEVPDVAIARRVVELALHRVSADWRDQSNPPTANRLQIETTIAVRPQIASSEGDLKVQHDIEPA